jgi:hypothetical protein
MTKRKMTKRIRTQLNRPHQVKTGKLSLMKLNKHLLRKKKAINQMKAMSLEMKQNWSRLKKSILKRKRMRFWMNLKLLRKMRKNKKHLRKLNLMKHQNKLESRLKRKMNFLLHLLHRSRY